jgi:hypothetical protein
MGVISRSSRATPRNILFVIGTESKAPSSHTPTACHGHPGQAYCNLWFPGELLPLRSALNLSRVAFNISNTKMRA